MKLFFVAYLFAFLPFIHSAQENPGFAVVELFSSEGNSNSPAADKLLSEIGKEASLNNKNIFCLTYHVDYWNKLGWKDPFSKFQYTRRQENYSRVLPSKEMYTPQIIINGTKEFTEADASKIRTTISTVLTNSQDIQLNLNLDSIKQDTAYVSWTVSKEDKNNVLQLAYTESGLISKVEKGENAGKTLLHDHVVRVFTAVNNPGITGRIKMYLKDRKANPNGEIIGFVQQKQNYKISGAARIRLE